MIKRLITLFFLLLPLFLLYSEESGDTTINGSSIDSNDYFTYKEDFKSRYQNFTKNRDKLDGIAPYFNGKDNYIEIPSPVSTLQNGTISLWVKFDSGPTKNEPLKIFYEIVSGKPSSYVANDWGLALYNDFYNGITFAIVDSITNEGFFLASNFIPSLKRWYHLTVTWGSGGMKLYIDGALYNQNNFYGTFGSHNSKIFYGVGTYNNSFFNGALDEVSIIAKELTERDIANYYAKNSQKSNNTHKLIDMVDLSTDKKNFSLREINLSGESQKVFKFNGISNYIELENILEESRYGTIDTWVRFDDYAFNEEPLKIFFEIASNSPSKMKDGDWGLALFLHNSTGISFAIYNSKLGQSFANSGFYPLLGRWYNIKATWGSGGMKLYIDGKLRVKTDFKGSFDDYQDKILIGAGTYPKSFFNGAVREITVYDKVFSESEVLNSYNEHKEKVKKRFEIKKIDFNFTKKESSLTFSELTKKYRKNMLISGAITGGTGLLFLGISPLFVYFSNYYKKYYNITNYFYENVSSKGEVDYYYDILKHYSILTNTFSTLMILSLPFGISLSITSFIIFIMQNYYIKDKKIIDLNLYFEEDQKLTLSFGVNL